MRSEFYVEEPINTREIGSLVLASLRCRLKSQANPGQCVKINNRWFAIADQVDDVLKLVVNKNSPLLKEPYDSIDGPLGAGFKNTDTNSAVIIVGGSGLGAVSMLIRRRVIEGAETRVIIYGRNPAKGDIKSVFPFLTACKELVFCDTLNDGRPADPFDPLSHVPDDCHVFVAGPKSLVDAVKLSATTRKFRVETNF
jgi:NAD(P)H-flavin reductase